MHRRVGFKFLACLFGTLISCSDNNPKAPGPNFRAQVVVLSGVESNYGPAQFSIQEREFPTLQNLNDLDGPYLKIVSGGELRINEINGSIVESDKFEGGESPTLRYSVKNGVVVPKDYKTLVLLSAYYQFENAFRNLESKLKLSLSDLVATAKDNKFILMFEPNIVLDGATSTTVETAKLNAAYMPGQKQFMLFRRSSVERLPLATNEQVISHEFGHAIFEKVFFQDASNAEGRLENEYAIRGVNEGFADFVSLVFTGSADVMRGSLDILSIAEERDFNRAKFNYTDFSRVIDTADGPCQGEFYCIGTIFARSLLRARTKLNDQNILAEDEFASTLVEALGKTKAKMETFDLPARLSPEKEGKESNRAHDGRVLGIFLTSLASQMPQSTRSILCEEFSSPDEFGEFGFPEDLLSKCGE